MLGTFRFFGEHPLTREARAAALRRYVSWQIKSRLRDEIIHPWIGGAKLAVRRGMRGATGNIYCGLHEFSDMAFLLHFLREGDLFVDAGANVGTYTVLASGVVPARTHAFEPDENSLTGLERNLEINGLQDLVTVHPVVLGAEAGEVSFSTGRDTENKVTQASAETRLVNQTTLDEALGGEEPTLIKLDVEGYEEQVLTGASQTLSGEACQAVLTESVSPEIVALLTGAGFERRHYDPFQRALLLEPTGYHASNALFVQNLAEVEGRVTTAPKFNVLGQDI